MTSQLVKVRREKIAACMTCPLCNRLLREATTIFECLHTFCRKCIYKKLSDEEVDCCPICNIDLGCVPVEKLRPDHNLQDVRSKIFPFKRRKVKAPENITSVSVPAKRKERSLSSLVVSTPQVSIQTGLTGRRTKSVPRKTSTLKGNNFSIEEPIKKEEDSVEDQQESSSSPETLNKIAQNRRQGSFNAEPSNHQTSNEDTKIGEQWEGKVDLWKPLNCLVEAANITKSFKFNSQGSVAKSESAHDPDGEVNMPKPKTRERRQPKALDDENDATTLGLVKPRKLNMRGRKRASASWVPSKSAQAILDAAGSKHNRGINQIWFTLMASEEQEGDAPLPQISSCYLRIKDGTIPISFIQKYLAKKLDLLSETEVEITCRGQPVVPTLQLNNLVDLWLQTAPITERVLASVGTSAKDFVMVLAYARKVQPPLRV